MQVTTKEQITLWIVRGVLEEMEPAVQEKVEAAAVALRSVLNHHGEEGRFALALVAAEFNAKED